MNLSQAIEALVVATQADNRSKRTWQGYASNLRYLLGFLGDVDVATVTIQDLRRYSVHLQGRNQRYVGHPMSAPVEGGLSPFSVASYLRSVRRLFKWLKDEGCIESNPAEKLKLPNAKRTEPKAISLDSFAALLEATSGEDPMQVRDRAILLFLADTGCRAGGITRLRVQDVDLQRCDATITEKGQKTRIVPFTAITRDALAKWLTMRPQGGADWFFVPMRKCSSDRLTEEGLGEMLRRLKQRAGVKGPVNPHSFRHAFAREWLRNGGDISTLAKVLGHSDPGVTMRSYTIFSSDELRDFHQKYSPIAKLKATAE